MLPRLVEEVTQPLQQLAADRGCRMTVRASPLPPRSAPTAPRCG